MKRSVLVVAHTWSPLSTRTVLLMNLLISCIPSTLIAVQESRLGS